MAELPRALENGRKIDVNSEITAGKITTPEKGDVIRIFFSFVRYKV